MDSSLSPNKIMHFKELLCCSESRTKLLVWGGRGAIFHFSFFHVTGSREQKISTLTEQAKRAGTTEGITLSKRV